MVGRVETAFSLRLPCSDARKVRCTYARGNCRGGYAWLDDARYVATFRTGVLMAAVARLTSLHTGRKL